MLRLQGFMLGHRRPLEAGKLDSAACCLVGGIPALGSWDPKQAPKLSQRRVDRATTIWEGCLDGIEDG